MRYTVHLYRGHIMDDATEFYEERAAIIQYDGGRKRHDAEYSAEHLTRKYCERKGKPLPTHKACFRIYDRGRSEWDEETGRAYYVPPPSYEEITKTMRTQTPALR